MSARRALKWFAAGALLLVLLLVATLALPIAEWRTGRLPVTPLVLAKGGPEVSMPRRVWIDTDAACGVAGADPDDCFAIALLAGAPDIEIVGISTVFGNAALAATDRITRRLAAALPQAAARAIPVHTGAARAEDLSMSPAAAALRRALEEGPLTILVLGPLTNLAAALVERRDLQRNVARIVAVMGRRPGHIFHPAEGEGARMLLGHGPVFRDLNLVADSRAAGAVLAMALPLTLVPYDAAREIRLTAGDLARIAAAGPARREIVAQSQAWLAFWQDDIGAEGFAPFDLLAAAYVLAPARFDCARARARVAPDEKLWHGWFYGPDALLVDPPDAREPGISVVYCPQLAPDAASWLVSRLARTNEAQHRGPHGR